MEPEVSFILERIRNDYLNSDGLLSMTFPPSQQHLLNDLDDYAPFISFLGDTGFACKQVSSAKRKVINGLIPVHDRIISWRQNEWLGAIYGMSLQCDNPDITYMIRDGLEFIRKNLIDDGFIKAFFNIRSQRSPAIFDSRTGALIETLLDVGSDYPLAKDVALNCLAGLVEWAKKNNRYLVPNYIFYNSVVRNNLSRINPLRIPKKYIYPYAARFDAVADSLLMFPFGEEIKLTKQNTNLVHAFLRAYRLTGDRKYYGFVQGWMKEFVLRMFSNGRCYSCPGRKLVKLSHNHPVIDIYLEVFRLTGSREALEIAIQIIDFWVGSRFQNGLFPAFEGSFYSHLDGQTDMIVILVKLSKLLNSDKYLTLAHDTLDSVIRNHKVDKGFSTYAYADGRSTIDMVAIHPKYNALLLKAFIALENRDRILDEDFWGLLRDR